MKKVRPTACNFKGNRQRRRGLGGRLNPVEIWEDPDGTRKYFSSYIEEDGKDTGKKWCIAFTLSRDKDNMKINTFYHVVRNTGNKRNGKLLYPQKKEAGEITPGT